MDVTFFAEKEGGDINSFDEVPENSLLAGGRFTKDQIGDLLGCFKCSASALSDNLWILPTSFSENLAVIDDEQLKNIAIDWADEHSWENTNINSMDLAGHLLELKYAYLSHSSTKVFALFE